MKLSRNLKRAFRGLSFSVVCVAEHTQVLLTPLSPLQLRLLALLDLLLDLYENVRRNFPISPQNTSEP